MVDYPDVRAENLDDAWSNFDPDVPLESGSDFFVRQQPDPIGPLRRALLHRHRTPQKYFLAGFKGSGKSTQINQLANDPKLNDKYFIVDFSIRNTSDERNINYVDLLIAIGAQLFITYKDSGGKLDESLYKEVQSWGRVIEERIKEKGVGSLVEGEVGGGVPAWLGFFFAKITAKSKAEAKSRDVIREVLEPRLTELLGNIDLIATGIQAKTKKEVLVFVDDTDKPLVDQATLLFKDHLAPLLQPNLHIVYTVPIWVCYSDEFPEIRSPKATVLPNVRLYNRDNPKTLDPHGMDIMREFISSRMDASLIDDNALEYAIQMSGGVFREATRIMQMAIDSALEEDGERVSLDNVRKAVGDLRRDYRRLITELDEDALVTLRAIRDKRDYVGSERVGRFLNNLLVLEYLDENGDNWPDVNPILRDIL